MAPKRRRTGWLKWGVILLLVGGGLAFYWKKRQSGAEPVKLKTVLVERGDIIQTVTASGQIVPVKNVQIGTEVSGIIREVLVDFNSRVTNGQVIARIDPSTYQQMITQSEAELENARAALMYAEVNHKRSKELHANSLLSPSDYEKTVADLHQAQAVVRMREAVLSRNKVDLEKTTIIAPVDGVVISRAVDEGQTVAASFSTPTLFQIANDLRKMRIEAMVSEADVGGVEEGQEVTFTVDAFPMRKFEGVVSQVRFAPITNQNVVSYTTVVDVDNHDLKLRPGMTATASIITGERKNVIRVPNAALRFRPPEEMLPREEKATNRVAAVGDSPPGGISIPGPGGSPGDREEMRRRFESMSPEEREQFRARMRAGGGRGAPEGRGSRTEGPVTRTIYLTDAASTNSVSPTLKPMTITTGVSDGSFTEVLAGVSEGQVVATGLNTPTAVAGPTPPRSPFGGGPFGGGGPRPR